MLVVQAGSTCEFLYGCVGCNEKVFSSKDHGDSCENCGSARYDAAGKPRSQQRVIHFPLESRLRSLLACRTYVQSVRYENERAKRNTEYISGIYMFLTCCFVFLIIIVINYCLLLLPRRVRFPLVARAHGACITKTRTDGFSDVHGRSSGVQQ